LPDLSEHIDTTGSSDSVGKDVSAATPQAASHHIVGVVVIVAERDMIL
jgi:hypothetical protein